MSQVIITDANQSLALEDGVTEEVRAFIQDVVKGVDGVLSPEFEAIKTGAEAARDASITAYRSLGKIYKDSFEVNAVAEQIGANIINWGECDCVFCRVETASPEEVMKFNCTCGKEIVVMNEEWGAIQCPECDKVIMRDKVIDLPNNNFKFIDIPGLEGTDDNEEEDDDGKEES